MVSQTFFGFFIVNTALSVALNGLDILSRMNRVAIERVSQATVGQAVARRSSQSVASKMRSAIRSSRVGSVIP